VKRRRPHLILLGCVVATTFAVFVWPREREPEYNGIPLSTWLEQYQGRGDEFPRAIRHMGTNALPFLIRAVKYEEPRWRTWVGRATSHWPRSLLNNQLGHWLLGRSPEFRASGSVFAFAILGANARSALDELERTAKFSKNQNASARAKACLLFIRGRIEV
jgi:hypothetical protein